MKRNYTVSFVQNEVAQCRLVKAESSEQALAYFAEIEPAAKICGADLDQCNLERRGCPVETVPDGWTPAPAQPEAEQETGDFTAPETIENAEARHEETRRELALMESAAKARHEAYKNALHGGTKEEKDKAHAELESAEAALSEYRLFAAIIEENARAAWLSENLPKICAVLNKYTGRKIGEKTRDKIGEELTAAIGCRAGVSLARECYERDHVYINAPYWSQWLELHKQYPADKFRDADGKLFRFAPEDFTATADFCKNPNAKLREILAAHAALMAAREALQTAISNYNCAVGRVFERANVSEWYKQPNITPAKR